MRGTVREGKGGGEDEEEEEGGEGESNSKTISYTSYSNEWATDTKRNGREEEGTGGRNKKKRLVMSVLSVTSFVDSHRVSMTTVKNPLGRAIQDTEAPLVLIYSLT